MYRWTKLETIPRGHRIFRDEVSGKIAIADNSGSTPDSTDDGVLWLDTTKPITVGLLGGVTVPVLDEQGNEARVGIGEGMLMHYAVTYGFRIETQDGTYTILRETA